MSPSIGRIRELSRVSQIKQHSNAVYLPQTANYQPPSTNHHYRHQRHHRRNYRGSRGRPEAPRRKANSLIKIANHSGIRTKSHHFSFHFYPILRVFLVGVKTCDFCPVLTPVFNIFIISLLWQSHDFSQKSYKKPPKCP